MIKETIILNEHFYFDTDTFVVSRNCFDFLQVDIGNLKREIVSEKYSLPNYYTFCINLSDGCNFSCDYCFNQHKSNTMISGTTAIEFLEVMFKTFPNGDKYYIDLSGKGEPLLNIKTILEIANWRNKKQDEIKAEILIQFVTNGYLLNSITAKILQENNILFGVSLDGNKEIHNLHRKNKNGEDTYDFIIDNIRSINNRDYIGCAVTLTRNTFNLVNSIKELSQIFHTISYRPVRGSNICFDIDSEKKWEKEYDNLFYFLKSEIYKGDDRFFKILMNGDDYFGRYLCRLFSNTRVITRCDSNINRFTINTADKTIYGCPALSVISEQGISMKSAEDLAKNRENNIKNSTMECINCEYKLMCGGECALERKENGLPNENMCSFKKHLINLSSLLFLTCFEDNQQLFDKLVFFSIQKNKRNQKNTDLLNFIDKNKLSFTEGKRIFDKINKMY